MKNLIRDFKIGKYNFISKLLFKITETDEKSFLKNFFISIQLKSFSDAILSQQPSPKIFLQILSLILTNLDQIHRDLYKITRKFFGKNLCHLNFFIKQ